MIRVYTFVIHSCPVEGRAYAHDAMGRRIGPSWWNPYNNFFGPANKGCGICYPVCGMVHIKYSLLLIGKS